MLGHVAERRGELQNPGNESSAVTHQQTLGNNSAVLSQLPAPQDYAGRSAPIFPGGGEANGAVQASTDAADAAFETGGRGARRVPSNEAESCRAALLKHPKINGGNAEVRHSRALSFVCRVRRRKLKSEKELHDFVGVESPTPPRTDGGETAV
ncbi:hypothetical protein AAFF_G00349200 [Aldrovandia affinis]|uniref:Uncharacterized protein n=1 Tax=Aldrovandia affinis TaxID=143900 RepID=A0AAD7SJ56_9TELE|nr:hypothetical protein AAFF_G00349200 [Aldrovandia affinis]